MQKHKLNKKLLFSLILVGFLFFQTLPVKAATIEKIPSADQIKYFRVVKQEGGTLYGIRIAQAPKVEQKIEKIPSPDQIKYFRVVKKEGGSLYGIRISSASTVSLEKNTKSEEKSGELKNLNNLVNKSSLKIERDSRAFTANAILNIDLEDKAENLPWQLEALSPVFSYSFATNGLYDPAFPLELRVYYPSDNHDLKKVFSFNASSKTWTQVDTTQNAKEGYLSFKSNSVSGKLILLSEPGKMSTGKASWYKYKNGLFAASPDYPKGTTLRVYNLANGKSVDVVVNDYGPDRKIHPDRVIDLDYVAFEKLASPSAGIINVRVEALNTLSQAPAQAVNLELKPEITASAAIIINEKDGSVVFSKEAEKVLPIASLSKIVFAKVFLDLKPDFKKVVTYKYQDEAYNYEHCEPWESARLRVKEGDTMTIGDLFYSAVMASANNAVETLVRNSGLSRDEFIKRMNEYATKLGAKNTRFVEPTGLSPDNVSSPADYAIIAREILKDDLLMKVSATSSYSFTTINAQSVHNLKNTNNLLVKDTYKITGSKTGYLHEAGYCLMTKVESPQGNLIVVNLNSKTKADRDAENEKLVRYGLKFLNL